jgi:hypothetical protein
VDTAFIVHFNIDLTSLGLDLTCGLSAKFRYPFVVSFLRFVHAPNTTAWKHTKAVDVITTLEWSALGRLTTATPVLHSRRDDTRSLHLVAEE